MSLNPLYITAIDLCENMLDKDTGQPLANGTVQFWQDASRTTPKAVYELTGAPPNYTYTALPNPIILSNTGNFQDNAGNNIAVYYFPYDANGNVQLYYIAVFNSLGVEQFTREAWPNITSTSVPEIANANYANELTNPQFNTVSFAPATSFTLSFTGNGTTTTNIAPGWQLVTQYTGTGTVIVAQNSYAGVNQYPNNPPFTLSITPGTNVLSLSLVQTLSNDPSIWSPLGSPGGYVGTSIALNNNSAITGITYAPSNGSPTTLLGAQNNTGMGKWVTFSATVQLATPTSTDTGVSGYVNIVIGLSTSIVTELTNVQVVGLATNTVVSYDETSSNRQKDFMFHYYNPLLQAKPIPSWLVGWDFPFNPTQALGASVSANSAGANKSYYAWDQTIVFQSANSGVTISRDASGALKTLSAPMAGTQLALIQYLPAAEAIEMLSRRKCVNVSANASVATGATVSLWYMKGSLPSCIASNLSLVLTLDPNGYPATQNGTWIPVTRSGYGTGAGQNGAQITIGTSANANFNQYPLSGWDMVGAVDTQSATFFAIVVGTAALANNDYVLWQSISCQDGDIATLPAPKSANQHIADCQRYYQMSFPIGTVPAQNKTANTGEYVFPQTTANPNAGYSTYVAFANRMYSAPASITVIGAITLYNPAAANAQVRNYGANSDWSGSTTYEPTNGGFNVTGTPASGGIGSAAAFHWTADSRLGQ